MKQSTACRRLIVPTMVSAIAVFVFALVTLVVNAQPPIPHSVEGRSACLACHQTGVAGAPRVSGDHKGRTNETCRQCHHAGTESAAVPLIPHPVEGRNDCLACHKSGVGGAVQVPADHAGRANEACGQCHVVASTPLTAPYIPHALEGRDECLVCHQEGVGDATQVPASHAERTSESCRYCHVAPAIASPPLPAIPHSTEGREACTLCHTAGSDEPLEIPADHAGRPNEICQTCHQPPVIVAVTPAPTPLPTPIQHPAVYSGNSCLECHKGLGGKFLDIALQWEESDHADHDVTCADCHGGDPGASEQIAAKSPGAGYIGTPAKSAIPALCGSCHADPVLMQPYGLSVGQLDEYPKSMHGQRLAQGDENVATCYDCHGGHAIKRITDPASSVYPTNLPTTCARCHADEKRMSPYGIPTNQYELYRESVHGIALLEQGNLESPSCPTCHGSHGANLLGYAEVVDVCGKCHLGPDRNYLTGGHRRGIHKSSAAPRCIDCHGRYDVGPATLDLFVGDEPRHCGSCHAPDSLEREAADEIYHTLAGASQAFEAAEGALSEARIQGIGLDKEETRLEEARTRLVEAAEVQHAVQLETIKEKTDEVESISVEVQEAAEKATAGRKQQRLLPGQITAVVLAVGGVAFVVLRRRRKVG